MRDFLKFDDDFVGEVPSFDIRSVRSTKSKLSDEVMVFFSSLAFPSALTLGT